MLSAVSRGFFLYLIFSFLFITVDLFADTMKVRPGEYLVAPKVSLRSNAGFVKPKLVTMGVQTRSLNESADFDRDTHESDCEAIAAKEGMSRNDIICEPNEILTIDAIPNDSEFSKLYGMSIIAAPNAWEISTGSKDVVVAVLDTGVDYTHPDLRDNMWTNNGEIPGNGVDDDENGYIDDYYGANFYRDTGDPYDDHGHGTHCAGTIGATGNNSIGVVGVNWNVKIMGLKFLSASGGGSTLDAVTGIDYAVEMGAHIINGSFGGRYPSTFLENAVQRADDAGVLFVAAAGNSGTNNDTIAHYPSNFTQDNVVAVAATDDKDKIAYFSNYGRYSVDLAAPGVSILSTLPGGYGSLSGTSMAAPHVAGLAALIKSHNPDFTAVQIKNLMMNTVDVLNKLGGVVASAGRINAAAALGSDDTSGGVGSEVPVGPTVLKISSFTKKSKSGGKTGLRRGESFVAKLRGDMTMEAELTLTLDNGTESYECSLGSVTVPKKGSLRVIGTIPKSSLAKSATLKAVSGELSASKTKRVIKSKKGRVKSKRVRSLESSCQQINARLRTRTR